MVKLDEEMEMRKLQVAIGNASMTAKERFIFYNLHLVQDSKKLAKKKKILLHRL